MRNDTIQNEIKKEQPYWHKLLIEWEKKKKTIPQNQGKGYSGLTLPFIIGVQKQPFLKVEKPIGIEQLFNDIEKYLTDENTGIQYQVRDCPLLNEKTLSYVTAHNIDYKIAFVANKKDVQLNKDHISELIRKYNGYIHEGKFSKNEGKWGDYSEVEINFIKKVLE